VDGHRYRFSVVAVNAIGSGPKAANIEIYAAEVPSAPSAPTLVSQSATAISISWTDLEVSLNGGS
jgi:hypothetical protein